MTYRGKRVLDSLMRVEVVNDFERKVCTKLNELCTRIHVYTCVSHSHHGFSLGVKFTPSMETV
jgi:hypothetical protein